MNESVVRQVINPGTVLWRVHSRDVRPQKLENGTAAFSDRQETALIEALLPDPRFTSTGRRTLPREQLADKVLSAVKTTAELIVARLDGPATVDEPSIHGVLWPSEQAMPEHTMLLFGDRCPPHALEPVGGQSVDLDDDAGAEWLNGALGRYGVECGPAGPGGLPLVFINYRTSAGTEEVWRLDDELRRRLGEQAVFRDHRKLRAGTEFGPELLRNARGADVMLSVIGERWDTTYDDRGRRVIDDSSDWVRREIAEALAHGVHVVPVLVGARRPLRAEELPEDIRKLAGLQFLHLKHRSTARDVAILVDELFDEVPLLAKAQADYLAVN